MTQSKIPMRWLALIVLAITGPAWGAPSSLSADEAKAFNTCLAMHSDQRASNGECVKVMQKSKVSNADMDKMKACESNTEPAVDNPDCMAMIHKHPDLVQGHGMETEKK